MKKILTDFLTNILFCILGDVILREEPYAAVLEAIFRVNHCAHCMKKTPTPIPCYECSTVRGTFKTFSIYNKYICYKGDFICPTFDYDQ